jgi:hypothetical protein
MNSSNTKIIVCRFNEPDDFLKKFNFNVIVYEKNKPDSTYIVEKNKGNEASAYLKYIVDYYDSLTPYTIFLHCHEYSWHHDGSIVDIVDKNINKQHTLTNLNNYVLGNIGNLMDSTNDFAIFFAQCISPAVGSYMMYPNFTSGVLGCAQFIVHKDIIHVHSKEFYVSLYKWLMDTPIDNYFNGRFLEWTWDLFWNKCLKNIPIKKYLCEIITEIKFGIEEQFNDKKKEEILLLLNKDDCYYVDNDEITIIINDNIKHKCKNQYIYNKYI